MIDIKLIRENPEIIEKDLKKRKDTEKLKSFEQLIKDDQEYRKNLFSLQKLRHSKNIITKEISQLKKQNKSISKKVKELQDLPKKIKVIEEKVNKLKEKIHFVFMQIPNIMHKSVPYGKDESENKEISTYGKPKKKFPFKLKSHGEAAEDLGVIDFKNGTKAAGKGFFYHIGDFALLNRALINFTVDELTKKGYTYVEPPYMINRAVVDGVTDYEFFKDMIYKAEGEDLHLIATSEHPLMGLFMNTTISEEKLPIKLCSYTVCFRKEIGSHGVDEKGIFRAHQFHKVEQVIICKPEDSWKYHEELRQNIEDIHKKLETPYRIVNICTGDLGIVAAKKYDLEVWSPRKNKYIEAGSCSNCTDYQCRRLNIKYGRPGMANNPFAHSLNCTAVATSRTLVNIMEERQQKDGTIEVPKVLQKYMFGKKVVKNGL